MSKKKPFVITGKHVLAGFVIFFGLIIIVNIQFAMVANKTFPGEIVKHSYVQGIHYNDTLMDREKATELGWNISWSLVEGEGDSHYYAVKVTGSGGPVNGLDISLNLQWAGAPELDAAISLTGNKDGVYRSKPSMEPLPDLPLFFTGTALRASDGAKMAFEGTR
jgi:nitrogen fixation protein FixH